MELTKAFLVKVIRKPRRLSSPFDTESFGSFTARPGLQEPKVVGQMGHIQLRAAARDGGY